MNFRRGVRREEPEINFIPLIDLLLVILIFLMVTTTYTRFTELELELPAASSREPEQRPVEILVAVTTTYTRFTELELELPAASSREPEQRPAEILVAVTSDGRYLIDDRPFVPRDAADFAAQLADAAKGREQPILVIHADAGATHQSVINVLEAARLAGMPRVTFAAQAPAAR